MVRGSSWVIAGSVLLLEQRVYAADPGTGYLQYQESPVTAATSSFSMLSYVGTLMMAFMVVLVLAYFTSRFIARKAGGYGLGTNSKILQVIPLGTNRAVYIIDILGKVMVLGVTEHSITILDEIDDQETVAKLRPEGQQATPPSVDQFQHLFKQQIDSLQRLSHLFPNKEKMKTVVFPQPDKKPDGGRDQR